MILKAPRPDQTIGYPAWLPNIGDQSAGGYRSFGILTKSPRIVRVLTVHGQLKSLLNSGFTLAMPGILVKTIHLNPVLIPLVAIKEPI
jgi:hypothetical protein